MSLVLQDWLAKLPLMQQTVVISALRGCDGTRKSDPTKIIVRALRNVLLHDATPGDSYMRLTVEPIKAIKEFIEDMDSYPLHFVMHLILAMEVVGYKHEAPQTRTFWFDAYHDCVTALHLSVETEDRFNQRLSDGRSEKEEHDLYHLPLWGGKLLHFLRSRLEPVQQLQREESGRRYSGGRRY